MTLLADHGILSGRGIPARRTRAMRTWVLSIVIGCTIICTKIAILALGDWILSQVPITRLVGDNKINDWKMFPDSQDHLGGVQPLQQPGSEPDQGHPQKIILCRSVFMGKL